MVIKRRTPAKATFVGVVFVFDRLGADFGQEFVHEAYKLYGQGMTFRDYGLEAEVMFGPAAHIFAAFNRGEDCIGFLLA